MQLPGSLVLNTDKLRGVLHIPHPCFQRPTRQLAGPCKVGSKACCEDFLSRPAKTAAY